MALARNNSRSSTAQAVGAIGVEIMTSVPGTADAEDPEWVEAVRPPAESARLERMAALT